jgi:hypothetical protein
MPGYQRVCIKKQGRGCLVWPSILIVVVAGEIKDWKLACHERQWHR